MTDKSNRECESCSRDLLDAQGMICWILLLIGMATGSWVLTAGQGHFANKTTAESDLEWRDGYTSMAVSVSLVIDNYWADLVDETTWIAPDAR